MSDINNLNDDVKAINNNFREVIIFLKNLEKSEYLSLDSDDLNNSEPKNFCVATYSPSESDNGVLYDEPVVTLEAVKKAKKFFDERNLKFTWPVLNPYVNYEHNREVLLQGGLVYDSDLTGMSLDVKDININEGYHNKISFRKVNTDDDAKLWAELACDFTESEETVPEFFYNLSCAMMKNKNIQQVICTVNINNEDKDVGTYLAFDDNLNNRGLYYMQVSPEFRRRKIANDMMKSIAAAAKADGKNKLVFQSLPSALPFHKNFGFKEIFNIPLFTN